MESPIFPWDKTEVRLSADTKQDLLPSHRKPFDPSKQGALWSQLQLLEMRHRSRLGGEQSRMDRCPHLC